MTTDHMPDDRPVLLLGPPFGMGRCVGASVTTWMRNALPFAIVSAMFEAPFLVLERLLEPILYGGGSGEYVVGVALTLLWFLSWNLSMGAITFGVLEARGGGRPPIRRCIRIAFRTIPTLLGISVRMIWQLFLVVVVVLVVWAVTAVILQIEIPEVGLPPGMEIYLYAALGVALLWYFTRSVTAGPAAVVERLGTVDAMARSRELSKGRRWAIAATVLVVTVPILVACARLTTLEQGHAGAWYESTTWRWTRVGVQHFVVSPLLATVVATIYHDLRRERDGVATKDLVRVFE